MQVIGSQSGLDVDAANLDRLPARAVPRVEGALRALSSDLDRYLDDTYTMWVKSPVVGVSVGWRFSLLNEPSSSSAE